MIDSDENDNPNNNPWESIFIDDYGSETERMRVGNGWIYKCLYYGGESSAMGMVYVKDEDDK